MALSLSAGRSLGPPSWGRGDNLAVAHCVQPRCDCRRKPDGGPATALADSRDYDGVSAPDQIGPEHSAFRRNHRPRAQSPMQIIVEPLCVVTALRLDRGVFPDFREGLGENLIALPLRNVLGRFRERDERPTAHAGGELLDEGEPPHSWTLRGGRSLEDLCLLEFYRGRWPKPVISSFMLVEESPVAGGHELEALAASGELFLERLPPGVRAAKISWHC